MITPYVRADIVYFISYTIAPVLLVFERVKT